MSLFKARRSVVAGLGMAATLALPLVGPGCGGSAPESGDAVVVPEPGAALPTVGTGATAAPGAGGTAAPAAAPTAAKEAAPAAPAAGATGGWGTLKGQVVFGGNPPGTPVLEEKGKAEKDPQFCAKDASIVSERLVVDKDTKGVKNVLVYFPKPGSVNDEAKKAAASAEVVFDQTKCIFEPHVLAVMADTKITLKSSDPVNHNVNAKLQKNGLFNSILASGQTLPYVPKTGERSPSPVTCDIHPWMQAWWMVLDNPYFAVTDAKGNFEIKNVPAGAHKVVVWQETTGFVTPPQGDELSIAAGDKATEKSWTIDPGKVKPAR